MTNQENLAMQLMKCSAEEAYETLGMLMLSYASMYTDSRLAVINWLKQEKECGTDVPEIGWKRDKCDDGIRIKIDTIPGHKFGKANPLWIDFNVEENILNKMKEGE